MAAPLTFSEVSCFPFRQARGIFRGCFAAALGHATVQTVYSYLGYYNVCNLGGEMKNPERNIPRAIFLSIVGIALLYFAMQTSILSVVPWQEAAKTKAVVSLVRRANLWAELGHVRHGADSDQRVRLDLFGHARLFAHSVRCSRGRQFLLRVRARPPHEALPERFACGAGRHRRHFLLIVADLSTRFAPSSRCAASSNLSARRSV